MPLSDPWLRSTGVQVSQASLSTRLCSQPVTREVLLRVRLRIQPLPCSSPRLCPTCAEACVNPVPSHRLVSKTYARWFSRLRPAELAALPHAAAPNPVNPAFLPMHLYRKADVLEAARKKEGTNARRAQRRKSAPPP